MSAKRPNVIWILGDQHRAQALGVNGDVNVRTPHIDNMAAMGLNFQRAVSGLPLCCPFRGSMLTGKYPHHCVPGHEIAMPEGPTIANVFSDNGYRTAYIGKWHLDGHVANWGTETYHVVDRERRGGFQYWVGYDNNNSQWNCYVHGDCDLSSGHYVLDREGDPDNTPYRLDGFETDKLTDIMIDYIRAQSNEQNAVQPFFGILSVQPPHDPYFAPAEYRRHNRETIQFRPNVPDVPRIREEAGRDLAGYYAMIENLDFNVGRVVDALREENLLENTQIIFFGDHGDMHGSHGQFRKTNPYEESIRVPFIIGGHYVGETDYNCGVTDALINHVDIAPTTLGLCGITPPDWMEGFDYSFLRKRGLERQELPDSAYLQNIIPTCHWDSVDQPYRGIVTRDGYKYVTFESVPWLLFNLNEDPYEQVNLAYNSKFWELRKRLHDRLQRWIDETGDKFNLPQV
ncbi:sulfatase family protein [Paenibacillus spongiae]|uniref:Sulfatase n=1 Tax=Paenibacillus spongiae TaxID=2909671 RepID=A0ABY5SG26_9BACL|nr:sulfatase [Paenibacillus spongiae]UVI32931.1 sulfatase [Paenibacillus spongiae]